MHNTTNTNVWQRRLGIVGLGLVTLLACTLVQQNGTSATSVPDDTAQPVTPTVEPPAEHRIGVRQGDNGPEFYDRQTGEKFVPRGANLWQWAYYGDGPDAPFIDTMFNTTDLGQLEPALDALRAMGAEGYNVVRVWSNACWGGAPGCMDVPSGMDPAYLENVATFLRVAQENGIYVMLTLDDVPGNGTYRIPMDLECCREFNGFNIDFLTEGGIQANRHYIVDTIEGLADIGAPMDAIWAYELRNEGFFEGQLPPLSNDSGTVTVANGNTYDMADPAQKRLMMEESWLYYIDEMVTAIKATDPTALVTMGFFVQKEPIEIMTGDPRLVYLERVLNDSTLDFVDLHGYPGFDLSMAQHAQNFTLPEFNNSKPLVLGEFGAHRFNFPDVNDAALRLQAWQVASCEYGFDGWMMWTWTGGEIQDEFWTAEEGQGAIARALSPNRNPDPCQPGAEMQAHPNLALFKPATASNAPEAGYSADNAFDLSMGSWWSAGGGPPQWIEVDLGAPQTISGVRLPIGHVTGEGFQRSLVWVRGPGTGNANQLLHEFSGEVYHGDVLEYILPEPMAGVQFVKLETLQADGWVIWHEIEVLRAVDE